MHVDIIDFQSPDAGKRFATSIHETGFAVFTNHPITQENASEILTAWQDFFKTDDKHNHLYDNNTQLGFFPFRSENAKGFKQKNLMEYFHFHKKAPLSGPLYDLTLGYYQKLHHIALTLAKWLQAELPKKIRLHIPQTLPTLLDDPDHNSVMRIIHYPPLQGDEEPGALRAAPHEDINIFTLLTGATAKGLQLKDNDGNWHDVPCVEGSLVINAGDMLQLMTDGYYRSTTHQVVNPSDDGSRSKPRYSIPMFVAPSHNGQLTNTVTAGDFLKERFIENGVLKK